MFLYLLYLIIERFTFYIQLIERFIIIDFIYYLEDLLAYISDLE